MGCADHRLSSVCHTHRSWGYVLHGNVVKGKKVKRQKCKKVKIGGLPSSRLVSPAMDL